MDVKTLLARNADAIFGMTYPKTKSDDQDIALAREILESNLMGECFTGWHRNYANEWSVFMHYEIQVCDC